ncbi:hypothetical protein V6N13_118747 [Hibiscus sabdariffa]|uniref:BHLH domain-containing protein n=1 Tax=Hibiscus sabdariffa TaxID=183260 RepID=A0ABR2DZ81_9ROSI
MADSSWDWRSVLNTEPDDSFLVIDQGKNVSSFPPSYSENTSIPIHSSSLFHSIPADSLEAKNLEAAALDGTNNLDVVADEAEKSRAKKRTAEKKRREKVVHDIDTLYNLLPISKECVAKPTKADKLDEIINYMEALKRELNMFKQTRSIEKMDFVSNSIEQLLTKVESDGITEVTIGNNCFPGARVSVDSFSLPVYLLPTFIQLKEKMDDIYSGCIFSHKIQEEMLTVFCVTLNEMQQTLLEQLMEKQILKWRDIINEALQMGFRVQFVKNHLMKITQLYIDLKYHQKLEHMQFSLFALDVKLNCLTREVKALSKMPETSKVFVDIAGSYIGKLVGIFEN